MAVSEQIVERIQKLLALAGNNPNEHEAASAAAKAQALMLEYDLSLGAVESFKVDKRTGAGVREGDSRTLRQKGKPGGWKVDLFRAVGQTSDVWVYASAGSAWYDGTGRYIGRQIDVEMAEYIFEFLVRELERLQVEFGKSRWAELKAYAKQWGMSTHEAERDFSQMNKHPLKAKQSWIEGAVEAVTSNLFAAKRERDQDPDARALVINKDAQIKDWWAQQQTYVNEAGERVHFTDYADYIARRKPVVPVEGKVKRLSQRDIDRMQRAAEREWEKQARAEARKWLSRDRDAYHAGRETGARVAVRPGVRSGPEGKGDRLLD